MAVGLTASAAGRLPRGSAVARPSPNSRLSLAHFRDQPGPPRPLIIISPNARTWASAVPVNHASQSQRPSAAQPLV